MDSLMFGIPNLRIFVFIYFKKINTIVYKSGLQDGARNRYLGQHPTIFVAEILCCRNTIMTKQILGV